MEQQKLTPKQEELEILLEKIAKNVMADLIFGN